MKYNLKNILSFLLVSLLPQLSGFILIKFYTDYLSRNDFGAYNALMALPPLLSVFVSLQLHSAISRFYFEHEEQDKRKNLVGTIVSLVLLSAVAFFSIVFAFQNDLSLMVLGAQFQTLNTEVTLILVIALLDIFVNTFNTILIVQEGGQKIVKRVAIVTLLQVSIIIVLLTQFDGNIFEILAAILSCALVNLCIVYAQTRSSFNFCLDFEWLSSVFKYSLPLIFHQMGGYLFNFSSVLILANKISLSQVAFFGVLIKLASINKIIVNAVNTAWQPSAFRKLRTDRKDGERYVLNSNRDFYSIYLIVFFIVVQGLSFVVNSLLSEDYSQIVFMLPLIMGAYLFRATYCFSTTNLFFDKKTHLIPIITIIAGLLNVIIVLLLVEELNYVAAVYSFVAAMFFMASVYALYSKVVYDANYFVYLITSVVAILGSYLVNSHMEFWQQNLVYSCVVASIVVVMAKKRIIKIELIKDFIRGKR